MAPLLQVALNGSRSPDEHPAIPRTSDELADAARASVDAGAEVLHLHVYDDRARETFAPEPSAETLAAVRSACPGIPISLTTSEGVEPDHIRRRDLVGGWIELPELVTANMGEAGIVTLCQDLSDRGVGIEAGLLSLSDAEAFVSSGAADLCVRVLIEPLDADPVAAVAHAAAMEELLTRSGIGLAQVHHGDGVASWAVNDRALNRGHGIRTGLEDTTVLPDGTAAADNAELVQTAARMIAAR